LRQNAGAVVTRLQAWRFCGLTAGSRSQPNEDWSRLRLSTVELAMMQPVKRSFDPESLFNPGRLLPSASQS
jgi:FAD/FMN-containing dehydrogenase